VVAHSCDFLFDGFEGIVGNQTGKIERPTSRFAMVKGTDVPSRLKKSV
jgi:hypothetical protein